MTHFIPVHAQALVASLMIANVAMADQATIRGRIESIDAAKREVKVQTVGGKDITLTADAKSELTFDGKLATLDKFRKGQRVRATFEVAGTVNRLASMRSAVPTESDLSRDLREAFATLKGYTFAQKDKYQSKGRELLDDVDDRMDDLAAKAKVASADARVKLNEQIAELKKKRDEFEKRLNNAQPGAESAWEAFKKGVSDAANDLDQAIDKFSMPPK